MKNNNNNNNNNNSNNNTINNNNNNNNNNSNSNTINNNNEIFPSNIIDNTSLPDTKFSVGQIVRHKQFGYRGVIVGWDKRPNQDVSSWQGVQNLILKSNQPFYNILADEDDIEVIN
jgi:hypothetical protein